MEQAKEILTPEVIALLDVLKCSIALYDMISLFHFHLTNMNTNI